MSCFQSNFVLIDSTSMISKNQFRLLNWMVLLKKSLLQKSKKVVRRLSTLSFDWAF